MTSNEIRETFLNFFSSRGHLIVPSAPLIAKNDPTLMFNNSGMAQFKDFFLENAKPPSKRIADTQKCLRVSGKHNDLEDVGFDTYHNTMFEMLGNWSFGDYFKKESLAWSWELLTEVYKIPKERIYVSVFGGDEIEGIPFDEEAYNIWENIIGDKTRIILGNKKDNFWEMGDVGPCGPSSEIHIDIRDDDEIEKISGLELINQDHPQVVEVWNNVFMQFERKADGSLINLPEKHVDTGLGFERICMVLQNKKSIYDTDIFRNSILKLEEMSSKRYNGSDALSDSSVNFIDVSIRVIVDHIRAVAFAIADGQLPSNSKAGYVIRRILRRAIRYGYSYLNFREPFMVKLIPILANQYSAVFPELFEQVEFVSKVIEEEEKTFLRTLDEGLSRIEKIFSNTTNAGEKIILGKQAFELSDTFGFPLDLTSLIARENGFSVDEVGFKKELSLQKERSRKDAVKESADWVDLEKMVGVEFLGYDHTELTSKLIKYRIVKTKKGTEIHLVLDKTPFYAEMGGQVGDTGFFEFTFNNKTLRVLIEDTKKENDLIIHITTDKSLLSLLDNDIIKPIIVKSYVDAERRQEISNNHTATHLMLAALKNVLGGHVIQRGSFVNENFLRFDFSHFSKVTDEEISEVERIVNNKIRENIPLLEEVNVPFNDAVKRGSTATFGEKYGDFVRVITFGSDFSVELCGGTHVSATGRIGIFKIISEGSVSSGVRRIEAVTSKKALEYVDEFILQTKKIKEILRSQNIIKSVESLVYEKNELQKKVDSLEIEKLNSLKKTLLTQVLNKNGTNILTEIVHVTSSNSLRLLAHEIQKELVNAYIVIGAVIENKPLIVVAISKNIIENLSLHAGNIIKDLTKEIKGTGGGQANFATGGGIEVNGLQKAIKTGRDLILNL